MNNDQLNVIIGGYKQQVAGLSAVQDKFIEMSGSVTLTDDQTADWNATSSAIATAEAQIAKYTALLT